MSEDSKHFGKKEAVLLFALACVTPVAGDVQAKVPDVVSPEKLVLQMNVFDAYKQEVFSQIEKVFILNEEVVLPEELLSEAEKLQAMRVDEIKAILKTFPEGSGKSFDYNQAELNNFLKNLRQAIQHKNQDDSLYLKQKEEQIRVFRMKLELMQTVFQRAKEKYAKYALYPFDLDLEKNYLVDLILALKMDAQVQYDWIKIKTFALQLQSKDLKTDQ